MIKCDQCDKPATRNIQHGCSIEWTINKKGNYSKNCEHLGDSEESYHLCDDCEEPDTF